jgi:cytochrome c-type biogenesis protein CcmH/NrfG
MITDYAAILRTMSDDRIQMLTQFLRENPNDAFARYGLAMEYANRRDVDAALSEFNRLLQIHPDYSAGYFMAAQMLARAARSDEAKTFLEGGIAAAARTGNSHAKSEMQAMLEELTA